MWGALMNQRLRLLRKLFRWNPILVMVLAGVLNLAAGLLGF